MIEYLVDGHKYLLSYRELRESYLNICDMSNEDFIKNLPTALHLACIICYVKEVPTYLCLNDRGIIHELVHLLHIPDTNTSTVDEIRQLFKQQLLLAP